MALAFFPTLLLMMPHIDSDAYFPVIGVGVCCMLAVLVPRVLLRKHRSDDGLVAAWRIASLAVGLLLMLGGGIYLTSIANRLLAGLLAATSIPIMALIVIVIIRRVLALRGLHGNQSKRWHSWGLGAASLWAAIPVVIDTWTRGLLATVYFLIAVVLACMLAINVAEDKLGV
jgi:hypothetical protein